MAGIKTLVEDKVTQEKVKDEMEMKEKVGLREEEEEVRKDTGGGGRSERGGGGRI